MFGFGSKKGLESKQSVSIPESKSSTGLPEIPKIELTALFLGYVERKNLSASDLEVYKASLQAFCSGILDAADRIIADYDTQNPVTSIPKTDPNYPYQFRLQKHWDARNAMITRLVAEKCVLPKNIIADTEYDLYHDVENTILLHKAAQEIGRNTLPENVNLREVEGIEPGSSRWEIFNTIDGTIIKEMPATFVEYHRNIMEARRIVFELLLRNLERLSVPRQ